MLRVVTSHKRFWLEVAFFCSTFLVQNHKCSYLRSFYYGMRVEDRSGLSQGEMLSFQKRISRIASLRRIFPQSQISMVSEDSSADFQTSVDLSCDPLFLSPSPTTKVADEMHQEQTPQVPPRIRTPQSQENAKQSSQPDTHLALPARKVSQHPRELSK